MTLPLDTAPYFTGPELTYSATGLPSGLAITSQTGVISGTPTTAENRAVTVTATNPAGTAQQSFTWTILAAASAPAQVTGLTATPGDGQVSLNWQAPADNGAVLSDYVIERRIGGGAFTVLADGVGTVTSYTDTGLTNASLHEYRVSGVNAEGQGSASTIVGATPQAAPAGGTLAVLAFDHGESGSVGTAVNSFAGLATAPGTVIIGVTHRGGADGNQVTGVTLGGQTASLVGRQYVIGQTKQESSFWQVDTTASSATVEVTTTAATSRVGIVLWSVGTLGAAPVFAATTQSGVSSLAQSIDVVAGGLVLGHVTSIAGSASATWTGLTADHQAEASPSYFHAAASQAFVDATVGHEVTTTFGSTYNNNALTLVALAS